MIIKSVPGKRLPNAGDVLVSGWTVPDTVCQMSVGMQSSDKFYLDSFVENEHTNGK